MSTKTTSSPHLIGRITRRVRLRAKIAAYSLVENWLGLTALAGWLWLIGVSTTDAMNAWWREPVITWWMQLAVAAVCVGLAAWAIRTERGRIPGWIVVWTAAATLSWTTVSLMVH